MGKTIDLEGHRFHRDVGETYIPMYYILDSASLLFLVYFFLVVPNDDPKSEREYRQALKKVQDEEQIVEIEDDDVWKSDLKKEKLDVNVKDAKVTRTSGAFWSLFKEKRFLYLLLLTFFIGYAKQVYSIVGPIYTEDYIAGRHNPDRKTAVSIQSLTGVLSEGIIFFW